MTHICVIRPHWVMQWASVVQWLAAPTLPHQTAVWGEALCGLLVWDTAKWSSGSGQCCGQHTRLSNSGWTSPRQQAVSQDTVFIMRSWHGNAFRIIGSMWRESPVDSPFKGQCVELRHCKNIWPFAGLRRDFGLILLKFLPVRLYCLVVVPGFDSMLYPEIVGYIHRLRETCQSSVLDQWKSGRTSEKYGRTNKTSLYNHF